MEEKKPPSKFYRYMMMIGHTCCDMNMAAIPALLPFLVIHRGIDYTAAAGLIFASSFLSSLIQPLLGMLADRKQRPWLMGLGILMTGFGVGAIGFMENYWGMFAVIVFAGVGSAMFHPEGGRMANCVAGKNKGTGIGAFAAGGNLGFVVGPIIAAFSVMTWGLRGTAAVLIPTTIIVAVFFALHKRLVQLSAIALVERREAVAASGQKDDWGALSRLCVSMFSRSIIHSGLQTFIPLYWVGVLLQTQQQGSLMITVMAIAFAAASFTGGWFADRFGFVRIIRVTFAAVAPLMIFLTLTGNVLLATALILPMAAALSTGFPPSVALGQKYLPNRLGMASGITLGIAVGVGGITSPLLGMIGDSHGLTVVLYVLAGVAVVGFLGTLIIKEPPSSTPPPPKADDESEEHTPAAAAAK
ncbi:MAG: MFS transporter [Oscillospiraceae bacterium]|nr:MFS transporter [Oscillospiraceae bacterium]